MPTVDNLLELSKDELTSRLRHAPWRRFVALGDSLTEGLGDSVPGYPDKPWAPAVAERLTELHPDFEFLNLGKRFLVAREIRRTQLQPALDFRPDLACVFAGGNDVTMNSFEPSVLERDLDAMMGELTRAGATVFTFSMMNVTRSGRYPQEAIDFIEPKLQTLREVVGRVAERHDAVFFDYFDHPIASDPEIMSEDMIHVNMRGQALLTAAILQGLAQQVPAVSPT
jgi:lysophospholipase L1-like esterase